VINPLKADVAPLRRAIARIRVRRGAGALKNLDEAHATYDRLIEALRSELDAFAAA